jgi:peroxiredoxin
MGIRTLATGDCAPAVSLVDESGIAHPLASLTAAGPVLLIFFKVSCPVCQLALPYLARIAGGALRVYGVSQDTPELTARFSKTYGARLAMLYDRGDDYPASSAFGLTNVPSLFVVEPGLRISYDLVGFHKADLLRLAERARRPIFSTQDNVPEWKAG